MAKIRKLETVGVRVPLEHLYRGSYYQMRNRCTVITRLHTDEGIVGETYNADSDDEQFAVRQIIHKELAPLVEGLDVTQPEAIWSAMLPVTLDQLRDRRLAMQAIACVDSAVWDAFGKLVGKPLWRLWGGFRDRIPAIGIGGYYGPSEHDVERDIQYFADEQGLVGMKFKVGGRSPEVDAQRLIRASQLVKSDFMFVADANQGYTLTEALHFVDLVREAGVNLRWFEEPTLWYGDWRTLKDVRTRANVSVAAGQSEISRVGMREMISAGAIDVCNFDASWGGGPTEWRRVASVAYSFGVELGHHEEGHLACQLLAAIPNGTFVECFVPARDPIFWCLWENRPSFVDGYMPLSEEPGLGLVLDDAYIRRYEVNG